KALGILAWRAHDYREALRWFRMAETEQTRFGGKWAPDLTASRQRLEAMIAGSPGPGAASQKPSATEEYLSRGSHYLEAAAGLGTKPRVTPLPHAEASRLAASVWAGDRRLSALLA